MSNILIIVEHSDGKIKGYSLELAGKASELAKTLGGAETAVVFNDAAGASKMLGNYGVKKVYTANHEMLKNYSGEGYAKVLCDIIKQESPKMVLATSSVMGKDLMATCAMRLKTGLASDCIGVTIEGDKLSLRRPVYAGKAIINVVINGTPQMATLRANTFPLIAPTTDQSEVVNFNVGLDGIKAVVKNVTEAESGMVDLTEADRIVSGGRAIGSADNFKMIKELAKTIGASVGASRAAVDAGYISHDHQVGQTGKTVNPTLYIACGISGAIQHLAGMRTSKVIVAINKDPEAPIFTKADYGIVGDVFKIVPVLTEKFKKLLQS